MKQIRNAFVDILWKIQVTAQQNYCYNPPLDSGKRKNWQVQKLFMQSSLD